MLLLAKEPRSKDKKIERVFKGERGVTVDTVYAFSQKAGDDPGSFVSPFEDMQLD